jgi:hypothetical protein
MTRKDLATLDIYMSIIAKVIKLPPLELAEYLVGRNLTDLAQVFDTVLASMGFVLHAIDADDNFMVMLAAMEGTMPAVAANGVLWVDLNAVLKEYELLEEDATPPVIGYHLLNEDCLVYYMLMGLGDPLFND